MSRHDLKIIVRTIRKHKGYAAVNMAGLVVGITLSLLILIYAHHEASVDRFNVHYDRIFRVGCRVNDAFQAPGVGRGIAGNIPGVAKVVRFRRSPDLLFRAQRPDGNLADEPIKIPMVLWADSDVFDIFSLSFISGDPSTAFKDPFSVVLTQSASQRLFGRDDPVGRTVQIGETRAVRITGLIRDPVNFHLTFDALGSFETLGRSGGDGFAFWNLPTYVLLEENAEPKAVAAQITRHFKEPLQKIFGAEVGFTLSSLRDIYFGVRGFGRHGSLSSIRAFTAIAGFILLIAVINFINLSTARASSRTREIGLKKVVGSSHRRLVRQFLGESVLFVTAAFLLALGAVRLLLRAYSRLIGIDLSYAAFFRPSVWIGLLAGAILIGLLAGLYPAAYLSSFRPVSILKGEKTAGKGAFRIRRGLIVGQFALCIGLIIGTMTVFRQLRHIKTMDLGFRKENVIQVPSRGRMDEMKNALGRIPGVLGVSFSNAYPGYIDNNESFVVDGRRCGFAAFTVDPDYFSLFGLRLKEGRLFSWDLATDQNDKCILNESAVRAFGLENPVGTKISHPRWKSSAFPAPVIEVIGVVKDFHFKSLHEEIGPLVFNWNKRLLWMANIRLSPSDVGGTLARLGAAWKDIAPAYPFEYEFLESTFHGLHEKDGRFGSILSCFTVLGIMIALLGLFALTSFTTAQRTAGC